MEELVKTQLEYSDGEGEMSRSASFSNRLSPQAFAEKASNPALARGSGGCGKDIIALGWRQSR